VTTEDLTQVRIAENQATFREANEKIETRTDHLEPDDEIPFLCECADRSCTILVRLSLAEYAEARRHPRRFINAPGHEAISLQTGAGVVADRRPGYVLVDKVGVAGDVAEAAYDGPVD
jgi:hypothetical protein